MKLIDMNIVIYAAWFGCRSERDDRSSRCTAVADKMVKESIIDFFA